MSQQPSDLPSTLGQPDPSGQPGVAPTPKLQQALEGLMVTLDDELLRYRQNRSGQGAPAGVSTPIKFKPSPARKSLNLIQLSNSAPSPSVPAGAARVATAMAATVPGLGASSTVAPPPPLNPRLQEMLNRQAMPTTQAYAPARPDTVRLRGGHALATYQAIPEDYLESSEALLGSLPQYSPQADWSEEDYQPSLARQLFTPLGIGALLLLLVGSASFGYLVTSPNTLSSLRNSPVWARWRGEQPEDVATADGEAPVESSVTPSIQSLGPDLSEPEFSNLDLNRVSTLPSESSPAARQPLPLGEGNVSVGQTGALPSPSGLPTSEAGTAARVRAEVVTTPQGIPAPTVAPGRSQASPSSAQPQAAAPRPAAPVQPAAQPPAQPAQSPPPALRVAPPAVNAQPPQPLAVNRTPQSLPTAPGPLAQPSAPPPITQAPPAASPSPSYYVVADYTGDQSLQSARGAVGDAYVRNFPNGARIQMGAFSQESSARGLVQQLQGQGIPAQVYSP